MSMVTDDGLLRRVVLTSLVVGAAVSLGLAAYLPWPAAANFAVGVAIGLASLSALAWLVSRVTDPTHQPGKAQLVVAALLNVGKYALIAAVLYLLLRSGRMQPVPLAAGFTVPTLVLCLKGAGRALNAKLGVEPTPPDAPERRP
jgi:ATP synthase I chain